MDKLYVIKGFYNNFFNKSIDCLFRTVEGVSAIFNTIPNPQESTAETPISGNNNIIINVDMSDGTHNAINSAVQSLATVEGQIVNVITDTNKKLETLKNTVAQINNLHAASKDYIDNVVQQSSTQLSLNALSSLSQRLDSQNRQLSAITDTLFGDRNSAGNCIDSPLTLMALA